MEQIGWAFCYFWLPGDMVRLAPRPLPVILGQCYFTERWTVQLPALQVFFGGWVGTIVQLHTKPSPSYKNTGPTPENWVLRMVLLGSSPSMSKKTT